MHIVFLVLLLLSPLPGCFALYRYLNRKAPEFVGRFLKGVKIKLSGGLILYVLILFLEIIFLCPDLIHLDVDNSRQRWHYDVLLSSVASDHNLQATGELQLQQYAGNVVMVTGLSRGVLDGIPKVGLRDHRYIYFPISRGLSPSLEMPPLVAFGVFHKTQMNLSVYSLSTNDTAHLNVWHGDMRLVRVWPFYYLWLAAFLPVLVVMALDYLGVWLSQSRLLMIKGRKTKDPSWFRLEFHGAIVTYFVVLSVVLIYANNGVPEFYCEHRDIAKQHCERFAGKKYFKAHVHSMNHKVAPFTTFGQFTTVCGKEITQAYVQGITYHVYGVDGQPMETQDLGWRTILTGIDKSQLFGIYDFGAAVSRTGLVIGDIDSRSGSYDFYYFDFQKHSATKPAVSGHMVISSEPVPVTQPTMVVLNQGVSK